MQIIGYMRVSTDEQASSGLGLEAQRAALEYYAAVRGLSLKCFEDAGLSGALPVAERAGLCAALASVKRGAVLLVSRIDRLARSLVISEQICDQIEGRGARVVSVAGEGTEASTPLMRQIFGAFAEEERRRIGARTSAALAAKRARGEVYGQVPFGWRREGVRLLVDAAQQIEAEQVRALRAAGETMRGIAAALGWSLGKVQRALASRTGAQEAAA